MFCTQCGHKNSDAATYCISCGHPIEKDEQIKPKPQTTQPPPQPVVTPQQQFQNPQGSNFQNSSGMGTASTLPPQLTGWNWGAFFLNWIWGIGNNTYIAFLCLIPFVNFVMIFILGAKGNEWAWQNKKWESIDHFKRVQKLWAIWGLVLFLLGILLSVLVIIAAMSVAESNYYYYE